MANRYNSSINIAGVPNLNSVTIDGTLYSITPIALNPATSGIEITVQDALNGIGLGFFFAVTLTGSTLHINSVCTNSTVDAITLSTGAATVNTTACTAGVSCGQPSPVVTFSGVLTVDCNNLSCLTFVDATGDYNGSVNPHGYGGPNHPSRAGIISITFNLWEGDTLLSSYQSNYLPNSSGTSSICLTADNFDMAFTPGTTYILEYQVNLEGSICTPIAAEFTFPCCGSAITSDLSTRFSIVEKLGATGFDFTDTTGTYDPATNPAGYGTPNPGYDDIISTLIVVTLENGTVINFTDFIPTEDEPLLFISATDLGYSETIPDQIITITYTVYVAGQCVIGYKSTQILFSALTFDCVYARGKAVLIDDCSCDTDNQADQAIALIVEYEQLVLAAQGNIGCVTGKIQSLYQICSKGCSTC